MGLMKNLSQKVPKCGGLVLDAFTRTLFSSEVCIVLDEYRRFVGFVMPGDCMEK